MEGRAGTVCGVLSSNATQEEIDRLVKMNEDYYGYKSYTKLEEN